MNRVAYLILDTGEKEESISPRSQTNSQDSNPTDARNGEVAKQGISGNGSSSSHELRETQLNSNSDSRGLDEPTTTKYLEAAKTLTLSSQRSKVTDDWSLTLEDFISSIQSEPELCQFFAEQYVIDLKGKNIDPHDNTYTASFMTAIK